MGSTDMGNVSQEVPSIHPMIAVAPPGVCIHTPEFAEHREGSPWRCRSAGRGEGHGCTVLDVWARGGESD